MSNRWLKYAPIYALGAFIAWFIAWWVWDSYNYDKDLENDVIREVGGVNGVF